MKKLLIILCVFIASCSKENKEQKEFDEMVAIAQQFANDTQIPTGTGVIPFSNDTIQKLQVR